MHKLFWHKYHHFAILLVGITYLPHSCAEHYTPIQPQVLEVGHTTDRCISSIKNCPFCLLRRRCSIRQYYVEDFMWLDAYVNQLLTLILRLFEPYLVTSCCCSCIFYYSYYWYWCSVYIIIKNAKRCRDGMPKSMHANKVEMMHESILAKPHPYNFFTLQLDVHGGLPKMSTSSTTFILVASS